MSASVAVSSWYAYHRIRENQFAEGYKTYKAMIALEPNEPYNYVKLADHCEKFSKLDEAESVYRLCESEKPLYQHAYFRHISLLRKNGREKEAIELLKQAKSMSDPSPSSDEAKDDLKGLELQAAILGVEDQFKSWPSRQPVPEYVCPY